MRGFYCTTPSSPHQKLSSLNSLIFRKERVDSVNQLDAWNLSIGEVEAGRSGVQGQLELHETCLQREKLNWAEEMAQQGKSLPYKCEDGSSGPQHPYKTAQQLTCNLSVEAVDPPHKLNCHARSSREVSSLITYIRDQRRHQMAALALCLPVHTDVPRHV